MSTPWAACRSLRQRPPPLPFLGQRTPMAAMHEEEIVNPLECSACRLTFVAALVATPGCLTGLAALAGNCGATEGLLTCSRCRSAWFCSVKCQRVRQVASGAPVLLLTAPAALHHSLAGAQAYWPFHKASCQRNEFADMAEAAEPKFAAWMRRHRKLAVLQDDEVPRHALPQHPLPRQHLPQGWLVRRAPEQRRPAPHRSTCWSARLRPRRVGRARRSWTACTTAWSPSPQVPAQRWTAAVPSRTGCWCR